MMIYLAVYLYVMGATTMWWFARATGKPMSAKIIATISWPVLVPIVAFWG